MTAPPRVATPKPETGGTMSKLTIPSRLYRAETGTLTRADPEGDARTVRLSFSSEAEVLRSFGWEVLGHASGEVDLSRIAEGNAPLLLDHMPTISAKVGTVLRAWIEDGRGVAEVRFAASAQADEILARIEGGEPFAVSVGYRIDRFAKQGEREGASVLRAVRWQPYEISLVAVPADVTVGVGRSAAGDQQISVQLEGDSMSEQNQITAPAAPVAPVDTAAILTAERGRVEHIRSVGAKMVLPADMIEAALKSGETAEAFNSRALDHLATPASTATRAREAMVGLSDKEVKAFSFVRLIDHLSDRADRGKREAAAFEVEAVTAAAEKYTGATRGVRIPVDVLTSPAFGKRAPSVMTAGVAVDGGNLVAKDLLSASFIDMLRATAVLPKLGARMLGGLVGNIDIPKKTAGSAAAWIAEDGTAANSGIKIGQVSGAPKTLSARTQLSRKLLKQSSLDVESLVRQDFAEVIGLEIDRCGIHGSAEVGAPDGLDDKAGINIVDFAVASRPTYAEVVACWEKVRSANAAVGSLGFTLSPAMVAHLMTTAKFAGGDTPIMTEIGKLLGYSAPESSQVLPTDLWFGNWSDFVILSWGGLDILVDPYTESTSGAVRVTAFQDTDFIVRNEKSFTRGRFLP